MTDNRDNQDGADGRESRGDEAKAGQTMLKGPRTWTMVVLTAVFVTLYVLALAGIIAPLDDDSAAARIEPILFAIIGYYFGREPSERIERTLSREVDEQGKLRQEAEKGEADQRVRAEQAETRIRDASLVLAPPPASGDRESTPLADRAPTEGAGGLSAAEAARRILDSKES